MSVYRVHACVSIPVRYCGHGASSDTHTVGDRQDSNEDHEVICLNARSFHWQSTNGQVNMY